MFHISVCMYITKSVPGKKDLSYFLLLVDENPSPIIQTQMRELRLENFWKPRSLCACVLCAIRFLKKLGKLIST